MAFTITSNKDIPPPATNKGEGKEFAINCKAHLNSCYKYIRGGDSKGYVLNPKIDFLIITLPVRDRDTRRLIAIHLSQMLMDRSEPDYVPFYSSHLPDKAKKNFHQYTHNMKIEDFPGLAAIQFKPKNSTYKDLKITLIPSRWNSDQVERFWDTLSEISNGIIDADYVIKHGNIRRIDWAIDFINVDTSDFLLQKKSVNKRKTVAYFGTDGGVETYYIGPNALKPSPQNYKAYIYDKRAKSLADKNPPEYNQLLHMRLEIRLLKKSLGELNLKSFCKLSGKPKNRFEVYQLTDFFAAVPDDVELQWHMFGDSCKIRGVDRALDMLPKDAKKVYKESMQEAQAICWRPDELWKATQKHTRFILGKAKTFSIKSG